MASFIYPPPDEGDFWNRYAAVSDDAIGLGIWREFGQRISLEDPALGWQWLDLIRAEGRRAKKAASRPCPRVFVSHKQEDKVLALGVSRYIHQQGFDVWIDIINLPNLPASNSFQRALLIAAIIEIGLINCTHLVAVMTKNSAPSRWIPYEYGRVKDDPPSRVTVAAVVEPSSLGNLPEYVHLAPVLRDPTQLADWLTAEKTHYPRSCFDKTPWPFD